MGFRWLGAGDDAYSTMGVIGTAISRMQAVLVIGRAAAMVLGVFAAARG